MAALQAQGGDADAPWKGCSSPEAVLSVVTKLSTARPEMRITGAAAELLAFFVITHVSPRRTRRRASWPHGSQILAVSLPPPTRRPPQPAPPRPPPAGKVLSILTPSPKREHVVGLLQLGQGPGLEALQASWLGTQGSPKHKLAA